MSDAFAKGMRYYPDCQVIRECGHWGRRKPRGTMNDGRCLCQRNAVYTHAQRDLTPELDRFQFDLFRSYLGPRILEIGAGGRRLTELVLQNVPCSEFVCIEPSVHFYDIIASRYASRRDTTVLKCTTSDIQHTYPQYFDSVFSVHVMEHIQDDRAFLAECLNLTCPGGVVIALVPALPWLYSNLDRNIGHYRRYATKMIQRLIAGLNATVEMLQCNNLLGVFASACFVKFRKLDYQTSSRSRTEFFRLYGLYSRFVVPVVARMERLASPPTDLNLTLILRKRALDAGTT